jgi:hypothetical protein
LLISQLLFILIATGYSLFYSYQRREKIACMTGMMIAMMTAMISSLLLGVMLGVKFQPNLEIPAVIAVVVGMIVGFAAGKPVSLMAAMDGMAAGVMGGMMGAMLGVMVSGLGWMIWFMDLVFILMEFTVFLLIQEEEKSYEQWKNRQEENTEEL